MNRFTGIPNTGSPTHSGHSIRALTLLALIAYALAGCQAQKKSNGMDVGAFMTVENMDRLKQDLREFGDFYDSTVDRASMEIENTSMSKKIRKKSITWHNHLTKQFRSVADESDPREACGKLRGAKHQRKLARPDGRVLRCRPVFQNAYEAATRRSIAGS